MGLRISNAPNEAEITTPTWKNWFRDIRDRLCRKIKFRATPLTGFSFQLTNEIDYVILTPAGVLATGSITLPAKPEDDQIINIVSTQNITAFTLTVQTGQSIIGAPTSLTANTPRAWLFDKQTSTWYRVV